MSKTNYKVECKRQKDQINELTKQVSTLKERLDVLRKAKSQTILKTEIVNREIHEPQFDNYNTDNSSPAPPPPPAIKTRSFGTNTEKPPTPPPQPPPQQTSPPPPKRTQRKRVKENWSQCTIYTANKVSQVQFVQTCHCEGVPSETSNLKSHPTSPCTKSPAAVVLPKISPPPNNTTSIKNAAPASPEIRTLSRMKTKDFISCEAHDAEIKAIQLAYKQERETRVNVHAKEVQSLKDTIEQLNSALKESVQENVKQTIQAPSGASVFHLYAEEKKRMEDQVRHLNTEMNKLRTKNKRLTQDLKEKDEEWEENEEAIKKHYVETWDEQYRSWMNKTESKMDFLRSSNENMQTFIMKNARHLPFAATDELKIYNEYGEKVSVFQ